MAPKAGKFGDPCSKKSQGLCALNTGVRGHGWRFLLASPPFPGSRCSRGAIDRSDKFNKSQLSLHQLTGAAAAYPGDRVWERARIHFNLGAVEISHPYIMHGIQGGGEKKA
ncbi:hypothetical protein CEXT_426281 [Caerostris extrusa]|uniref:Uncharacterized protein n=1 Tax=Caerostris extrusa TaxID=172846 RepID=A0AAV4SV85_CAEEX|nr:hypothetical protein CEXT_426281 [Caerostris extrusa]